MPWTKRDYPVSMKNLPEEVRSKAIEIANALLDEKKMEEGIAIATAISRAKDWAANRGKETEPSPSKHARTTDVKEHGKDRYVIPHNGEWAIRREDKEKIERTFHTKQEAVREARREAKHDNASLTIQRKTGKVEKRISYNPNRRAAKLKAL